MLSGRSEGSDIYNQLLGEPESSNKARDARVKLFLLK